MVHTTPTGEGRSDQGEESSGCLKERPEEVLGYETFRPPFFFFFGPPLRMNIIINEHAN